MKLDLYTTDKNQLRMDQLKPLQFPEETIKFPEENIRGKLLDIGLTGENQEERREGCRRFFYNLGVTRGPHSLELAQIVFPAILHIPGFSSFPENFCKSSLIVTFPFYNLQGCLSLMQH